MKDSQGESNADIRTLETQLSAAKDEIECLKRTQVEQRRILAAMDVDNLGYDEAIQLGDRHNN